MSLFTGGGDFSSLMSSFGAELPPSFHDVNQQSSQQLLEMDLLETAEGLD